MEWEEFEIENIVGNEERTITTHASVSTVKHENGYKEEGEKKKKKSKYDSCVKHSDYRKSFVTFRSMFLGLRWKSGRRDRLQAALEN